MLTSITQGPKARSSNFELLRMLAMFFVLVVHADFGAVGVPTPLEANTAPLATATRILIEFIAIVSVNLFVLISGWFGIRASIKGFAKFLFQVAFYSTVIYLGFVAFGLRPFTLQLLWDNAVLAWADGQWFIMSYMILFILSPVLNAYCEKASARQLGGFLLPFYAVQTFSSFFLAQPQFVDGYSALSFIGLYLLARWLRLHGRKITSPAAGLALTLIPLLVNTVTVYFVIRGAISGITTKFMYYSSPFIVAQSLGMLILFAGIKPFVSRVLNWFSSGCFAVFLIHFNPNVYIYFKNYVRTLYLDHSGPLAILTILAFLLGVFILSCLADKLIREPAWRAFERALPRRT